MDNLKSELEKAIPAFEEKERIQEQLDNEAKAKIAGLESIKNLSYDNVLDQHGKGDAWSSYYLGLMHLYGIKTTQDKQIALQYFTQAQERGHSMAKDMINQINRQQNEIEEKINNEQLEKKLEEEAKKPQDSKLEADKTAIEAQKQRTK